MADKKEHIRRIVKDILEESYKRNNIKYFNKKLKKTKDLYRIRFVSGNPNHSEGNILDELGYVAYIFPKSKIKSVFIYNEKSDRVFELSLDKPEFIGEALPADDLKLLVDFLHSGSNEQPGMEILFIIWNMRNCKDSINYINNFPNYKKLLE